MSKQIIGNPVVSYNTFNTCNYLTSYKLIILKHVNDNYQFENNLGMADDEAKRLAGGMTSNAVPLLPATFEWIASMFNFVNDKELVLVYDNAEGLWNFERDNTTLTNFLTDLFTVIRERALSEGDKVMLLYANYFLSGKTNTTIRRLSDTIIRSVHLCQRYSSDLIDSIENYRYFKDTNGMRYLMDLSKDNFNLEPVKLKDIQSKHLMSLSRVPINTTDDEPKLWLKLLNDYMLNDPDMLEYFYKVLAYLMSPYNYNQAFVYFYGESGRNGKSTVLKVLQDILGNHTIRLDSNLLNDNPPVSFKRDDALATCEGKSLLIFNEVEDRINASTRNIKELTEGGRDEFGNKIYVAVRPAYSKTYNVVIQGIPLIAANTLLRLNEWSSLEPVFKRLVIVPFNFKIVKEDPTILSRLAQEYPLIQRWLYKNYFKYKGIRIKDIQRPAKVESVFREYRNDSDIISSFWSECISVTGRDTDRVKQSQVYVMYKQFCKAYNRRPISNKGSNNFTSLLTPKLNELAQQGLIRFITPGNVPYIVGAKPSVAYEEMLKEINL